MSEVSDPVSPTETASTEKQSLHEFASSRRGKRKDWLFALKAAASILLLAFVLSRADLASVGAAIIGVEIQWVVLAIACQLLGSALIAFRWKGLLALHEIRPGFLYLYRSTLISGFFKQFMPSTLGGDVIRGYDAWRAGASTGLAFMSLLIDRLMGLLALLTLAMGALLISPQIADRLPGVQVWGALVFGVLILLLVFFARPHARQMPEADVEEQGGGKLQKILRSLALYRGSPKTLLRALGVSFLLQINVVTFYWALSMALGLSIAYADFYVIAPVAILVMMLPISINGIGVREGIFVFLLAQWGVGSAEAVALAWLEYGIFLAFGLFGGVLFALRRR